MRELRACACYPGASVFYYKRVSTFMCDVPEFRRIVPRDRVARATAHGPGRREVIDKLVVWFMLYRLLY